MRGRGGGLRFVVPDATPLPEDAAAWPLEPMEGPPHERLRFAGVTLDWWCPWGLNPSVKSWSGQQSAWTVHRNLHRALRGSKPSEWLRHAAPVAGGRLYLDPRSSWNTLELGWSLSAHRAYRAHARPWVELLASLGLQAFAVPGHRARGGFRYRLWRPAPLPVAHAAFAARAPTVETLGAWHVPTAKSGEQHRPSPRTTRTRRCNAMTPSIHALIADTALVALTLRQPLASVESSDVPVAPPTYPPPRETNAHRFDTPYPVNETRDGVRVCELDSVPSQGNRMEAAFTGVLADVVPHHVVRAGRFERDLTSLPHRIADAAIRATGLSERIREAFETFESGDAAPMARLAPTSLVYGAWDSRDTRVRIPRAIAATIRAVDVSVLTAFVAVLGRVRSGSARARRRGSGRRPPQQALPPPRASTARAGSSSMAPSSNRHRSCSKALRGYRTADASDVLPVVPARTRPRRARDHRAPLPAALGVRARARSGPPEWRAVSDSGERHRHRHRRARQSWPSFATRRARGPTPLTFRSAAPPIVHDFDPDRARTMLSAKTAAEQSS